MIDNKEIIGSNFRITILKDYDYKVKLFYDTARVSDGWFYGKEKELKKNRKEINNFKQPGLITTSFPCQIQPTHEVKSKIKDDDDLRFLIIGCGFLQALLLLPENFNYLYKTAYTPGKLNGLILCGDDYLNGMEIISNFYLNNDNKINLQMYAVLQWFLQGQSFIYDWEKFEAQYKVLDGIFQISGIKSENHPNRPINLAKKFNIELPDWAIIDQTKKNSRLSSLRNDLVHEAIYANHPIGFSFPEDNYSLEFRSFNLKLICSILGINTPYLKTNPKNNAYWAWDIKI